MTVSQYTPETFSNAREKFRTRDRGCCIAKDPNLDVVPPIPATFLSNNPLPRTTIRAFARKGGREGGSKSRARGWVCVCAGACARTGERVKLTYDKFNALLPVLPSFLPALTPMALGHAGPYYYFHSFPHVCLSVSSV